MRPQDRFLSRLKDLQTYGERSKLAVRGRNLDEMEPIEIDGLCYLVLIVSEAAIQSLAIDALLAERHPEVPWRAIRATGNRLRHGYATLDREVVHEVVSNGHIDQLLAMASAEITRIETDHSD